MSGARVSQVWALVLSLFPVSSLKRPRGNQEKHAGGVCATIPTGWLMGSPARRDLLASRLDFRTLARVLGF